MLYITEFPEFATLGAEAVHVGDLTPIVCQQVAPGQASARLSPQTSLVRLVTDTPLEVALGPAVTAANAVYLPANTPEYFAVVPGQVITTQVP